MSRTLYLVIAGLLSLNFLPNNILPVFTEDVLLVLFVLWCVYGILKFERRQNLCEYRNTKWLVFVFAILTLGLYNPIVNFNQGVIPTIIALRTFAAFIFYITLLKIVPVEDEIIKSFGILTVISVIFALISYINPNVFATEKSLEHFEYVQMTDGGDFVATWPGIWIIRLYFFISVYQMISKKQVKHLIICSVVLLFLLLQQNRSTLIIAIPIYFYGLLKSKFKYKYLIILLSTLLGGLFIYDILINLVDESINQLENVDYNRWQAFSFFIVEFGTSLFTFLFGHGVPCAGSSYLNELLYAQETRLAFIADIGMLGSYFYYGFIFCLIFYYYLIKIIFSNYTPLYLKFICVWICVVPTIHSIGLLGLTGYFIFSFIIYIYTYYAEHKRRHLNNYCKLQH